LIEQLDYIGPNGLGFDAIWISPIPRQLEGMYQNEYEAYHGYWQVDVSDSPSNVNHHFGTPQDLQDLIQACHSRNIWLMIDFVLNHAGPIGQNYGLVTPLNLSSHYHPDCAVNTYECQNENTLTCRLAHLADFNQDNPYVTDVLLKYTKYIASLADGIRADTVMYINNDFWKQATTASGTLIVGEVWSDWSCDMSYINNGVTSTLNYDLFFKLRSGFQQGGSLTQLGDQWRRVMALPFPYLEGNFIDNQDNDRFLQQSGTPMSAFYSAQSHAFFQVGIPIFYYCDEQDGQACQTGAVSDNTNRRPMWPTNFNQNTNTANWIKLANAAYKKFNLGQYVTYELWQDDNMYCFSRGPSMNAVGGVLHCVANTPGQAQTRNIPNLPFRSGQTVCDWLNPSHSCQSGNETMQITVQSDGMPILLYAKQ
jgi:alpha-amylase